MIPKVTFGTSVPTIRGPPPSKALQLPARVASDRGWVPFSLRAPVPRRWWSALAAQLSAQSVLRPVRPIRSLPSVPCRPLRRPFAPLRCRSALWGPSSSRGPADRHCRPGSGDLGDGSAHRVHGAVQGSRLQLVCPGCSSCVQAAARVSRLQLMGLTSPRRATRTGWTAFQEAPRHRSAKEYPRES